MMTRDQAKQALAATFCFKRVGNQIALRDSDLIEAILEHDVKHPTNAPQVLSYPESQPVQSP